MHDWQSLSHVRWECKYHIVIIPKYRKRMLYGKVKKHVGEVIKEVCRQRGIELVEGHLMPDHIHLCVSIPPKHSVAFAIGLSRARVRCESTGNTRPQEGDWAAFLEPGILRQHVGLNEETIRKYIENKSP